MKTTKLLVILTFFWLFALNGIVAQEIEKNQIEVDYFWMQGCTACGQMKNFLDEIKEEYDFKLNSYETSRHSSLFLEKLENTQVPSNKRGYVPAIFIEENYFIGYNQEITESIINILEGKEIENKNNLIGESVKTKVLGIWDFEISLNKKSIITAGIILAFLDSINVCSITVLVFLIIFTLSIGSLKKAFKIGITFTTVIFIFYAIFMILLTGILGYFVAQYGIYMRFIIITISLVAGFLLIKDYFWYGKGISLKIPNSAKPLLEKYMKQATIGSTIILGILASLVELPCTAVFPLIYTTILAENSIIGLQRILYILMYNLIYIWPLIFIVFGTYFSWTKIQDIDQKVQKFKTWMRLIAGIALILIATYFALPFIKG